MNKMVIAQNDVLPAVAATLTDPPGAQLNLFGANVMFRLVNYHTGVVKVYATALKLQNDQLPASFGQVAYNWTVGDTDTPGLYQAYFVVNFGNPASQSFPPEGDFYILIQPRP